jgi:hypothetical protein
VHHVARDGKFKGVTNAVYKNRVTLLGQRKGYTTHQADEAVGSFPKSTFVAPFPHSLQDGLDLGEGAIMAIHDPKTANDKRDNVK